jgi:hypothetical protein
LLFDGASKSALRTGWADATRFFFLAEAVRGVAGAFFGVGFFFFEADGLACCFCWGGCFALLLLRVVLTILCDCYRRGTNGFKKGGCVIAF